MYHKLTSIFCLSIKTLRNTGTVSNHQEHLTLFRSREALCCWFCVAEWQGFRGWSCLLGAKFGPGLITAGFENEPFENDSDRWGLGEDATNATDSIPLGPAKHTDKGRECVCGRTAVTQMARADSDSRESQRASAFLWEHSRAACVSDRLLRDC